MRTSVGHDRPALRDAARRILFEPVPIAPRWWKHAHTLLLILLAAHIPPALVAEGRAPRLVPALLAVVVASWALAAAKWLPTRAREVAAGVGLGLCPAFLTALPVPAVWADLDLLLVWLAVGLYRRWAPWLVVCAVTIGILLAGSAVDPRVGLSHHPGEPVTLLGQTEALLTAFAVLTAVFAATRALEAAAKSTRDQLEITRGLLVAVSASASSSHSLTEAAEPILEALCSPTWPVAHLHLRDGDEFVDSGLWCSHARREYPALVTATTPQTSRVGVHSSPLAWAVSQSPGPVWASTHMGSLALGPLAESLSPARARLAQEHGLATVLMCPVTVDGDVVAAVELFSPDSFLEEPPEASTILLMSSLLGRVAEREEHAEQLAQRHEMLRAIEETIPDSVVVFDIETRRVLLYSASGGRGRSRGEALGYTIEDLFRTSSTDFSGRHPEELLRELQSGSPVRVMSQNHHGEARPCELYYSERPVSGTELGFIFVRDVSEREQASQQVALASSRAQALLDVTDAGIVELDSSGDITFVNARGARLLSRSPGDLLGDPLSAHAPFLAPEIDRALAADASGVLRCTGELTVGNVRVPLAAAVTARGGQDRAAGLIVTLTDVTDAEHNVRLSTRHTHALELNDTVVQGLATAMYAIELGDSDAASLALGATLTSAKATISTLLADTPFDVSLLQRNRAAQMPVADGGDDA